MESPREARDAPTKPGPWRTCIGCRRVKLKAELVRLVRRPGGAVVRDPTGSGRGAYVCEIPACLERALQPGRFAHAFKRPSVPGPELAQQPSSERVVRSERSR